MGLINPDKLQQEFFVVKFLDREILGSVQKYVGIEDLPHIWGFLQGEKE